MTHFHPNNQRSGRWLALRRVGPVTVALLILFVGVVAVIYAAARPISVSLNGVTAWTFTWGTDASPGTLVTTGASVSVNQGSTINVDVTTELTGEGDDVWRATRLEILTSGGTVVVNDGCTDHGNTGTGPRTIGISTATAPGGTYDLRVTGYNGDDCASGGGGNNVARYVLLEDAITVIDPFVISAVTLNGGTAWTFNSSGALVTGGDPAFVAPSGNLTVVATVITAGDDANDNWESWRIQFQNGAGTTTATCETDPNYNGDGTYQDSQTRAVPATAGVYNLIVQGFNNSNSCSGTPDSVTLVGSVAVGVTPNPTGDPGCGFSMGVIVDSSGSIDDGGNADEQAVRDAVIELVTNLQGTGTEVSLINFNTTASVAFQPTVVNAAFVTAVTNYMNNTYNAGGSTNWEHAFFQQRNARASSASA